MTDIGTYLEVDGKPAVRFRRTYPHPVERVWAAVSQPGGLAHWFPSHVRIEERVGGAVEFSGDPNLPPDTGVVLAIEPPHRLAFTWGGDELHFLLEPADGGGCVFTLVNVLEARDTAARNAAGWAVCLAELDTHLRGGLAHGPHSDTALPWQEVYRTAVAAGLPSGAPIPGA